MGLTAEKKQELITKHGRSDGDTGSAEVQFEIVPGGHSHQVGHRGELTSTIECRTVVVPSTPTSSSCAR